MSNVVAQALFMATPPPPGIVTARDFQGPVSGSPITTPTITFPNMAVGPAAAGRAVYALISWNNGNTANHDQNRALLSCLIGGISATIIIQIQGDLGVEWCGCAIVAAILPTGTIANVVPTFQSGAPYYQAWCETYSGTGLANPLVPTDTFGNFIQTTNHTEDLNVLGGGIVLSPWMLSWDLTSTMNGVTRDYNKTFGNFVTEGGSANVSAPNASFGVQVITGGTANMMMVGASFR